MTDRALNLFFLALAALGGLLACLTYTGCTTYTVLPADREVVPVAPLENGERKTERAGPEGQTFHGYGTPEGRRTYVENEGPDATGWYVPDAVLLELLEAD